MAATCVPDFCSFDMVLSVRLDEGQCSEAFDDAVASFRASETLQKFLQNEPSAKDLVGSKKCIA